MSNHSSAPDNASNELARSALKALLAERPRYGAHLKVLLTQNMRLAGADPGVFFRRFPKFSAFLAANTDLVEVSPREGGGDVVVRLRKEAQPNTAPSLAERIRSDVWRAFTNPDPKRKRFFRPDKAEIRHFTEPPTQYNDKLWATNVKSEPAFVEIDYATAATQSDWMKEFLKAAAGLPDWMRRAAEHLVDVPYESSLETAYASTLGPQFGEAWRHFRTAKIIAHIQQWADGHGIPFDRLLHRDHATAQIQLPLGLAPSPPDNASEAETAIGAPPSEAGITPPDESRNQVAVLRALIEHCTEQELSAVLIPASLVGRLMRAR